jgi:hypothetical protein
MLPDPGVCSLLAGVETPALTINVARLCSSCSVFFAMYPINSIGIRLAALRKKIAAML